MSEPVETPTDDPSNPLPSFFRQMLAAASRHVLTGVAGSLAMLCGASHDQQVQFVSGGVSVILFLAGLGWSYLQKSSMRKGMVTAINAPTRPSPPVTEQTLSKGEF